VLFANPLFFHLFSSASERQKKAIPAEVCVKVPLIYPVSVHPRHPCYEVAKKIRVWRAFRQTLIFSSYLLGLWTPKESHTCRVLQYYLDPNRRLLSVFAASVQMLMQEAGKKTDFNNTLFRDEVLTNTAACTII
jgi:hypothetical protein